MNIGVPLGIPEEDSRVQNFGEDWSPWIGDGEEHISHTVLV